MPDSDPNLSDIALAKKRLAGDLRIIVIVQVVALCDLWVLWLTSPHDLAGAGIVQELTAVGMMMFPLAAIYGAVKLTNNASFSLPVRVRIYAFSVLGFPVLILSVLPVMPIHSVVLPSLLCFPFYCIIPQFFISRWLAKAAEEGTETVQDSE
jgi:hypothetical protein